MPTCRHCTYTPASRILSYKFQERDKSDKGKTRGKSCGTWVPTICRRAKYVPNVFRPRPACMHNKGEPKTKMRHRLSSDHCNLAGPPFLVSKRKKRGPMLSVRGICCCVVWGSLEIRVRLSKHLEGTNFMMYQNYMYRSPGHIHP